MQIATPPKKAPKPLPLTTTVAITSSTLQTISGFIQKSAVPVQQVLILLACMAASEVPQADLAKISGVSENAVSRHVNALGAGVPKEPGYGLVESFEDPEWRRRKLVRLTEKGRELAALVAQKTARYYH